MTRNVIQGFIFGMATGDYRQSSRRKCNKDHWNFGILMFLVILCSFLEFFYSNFWIFYSGSSFFLTVVGVNIFVTGFNETHKRKFSVKRENYFPLENQNKLAYYVTMKSLEPTSRLQTFLLNSRPRQEGSYKLGSDRKFSRDWLISFFWNLAWC